MSNCSNCFNGCAEIVSDKCVRYTGVDVAVLGIKNGDSLSFVEQALVTFLTSTLDGTGIHLDISSQIICELVNKNLVECEGLSLPNVIEALIKSICELGTGVSSLEASSEALEADYTIECLTGVTPTSGTHAILQATITKLCSVEVALNALALNVSTNYVKLADLNTLIQNYLNSISATTQQYTKMVPYTVVEYYGPLSNFDGSGKGLASAGFDKIYICNGQNGTPDKRGRVGVGAIQSVPGGGPLDPEVTPSVTSPNYSLNDKAGTNAVTLTTAQIPAHTHSINFNDPGHFTDIKVSGSISTSWPSTTGSSSPLTSVENVSVATSGTASVATTTTKAFTGITVGVNNTGGGTSHNNIQPVLACYYIMYIP